MIVLWFELLLRNAAIAVLIATSPIAAAGQASEATKAWWLRSVSATVQLIILKPVIALVFAVGLGMAGTSSGVESLLEGLLVLALAAFGWPVIARFFTFGSVQASSSGLATVLGFLAGQASQSGRRRHPGRGEPGPVVAWRRRAGPWPAAAGRRPARCGGTGPARARAGAPARQARERGASGGALGGAAALAASASRCRRRTRRDGAGGADGADRRARRNARAPTRTPRSPAASGPGQRSAGAGSAAAVAAAAPGLRPCLPTSYRPPFAERQRPVALTTSAMRRRAE